MISLPAVPHAPPAKGKKHPSGKKKHPSGRGHTPAATGTPAATPTPGATGTPGTAGTPSAAGTAGTARPNGTARPSGAGKAPAITVPAPASGNTPLLSDPLWKHNASTWLKDMAAMLLLGLAFTLIAWWRLVQLRPGRRR